MNITFIIVFSIMIIFALAGLHKGMAREISGLIAWTITLLVITLIAMLYSSLKTGETRNTVYSAVFLVLIAFVYGIVRLVLKSVKLLSKLPVLSFIDKLSGLIVGLGEGILVVWLLYVITQAGLFDTFSDIIYRDTANSVILSWLYEYNYLAKIIAAL